MECRSVKVFGKAKGEGCERMNDNAAAAAVSPGEVLMLSLIVIP